MGDVCDDTDIMDTVAASGGSNSLTAKRGQCYCKASMRSMLAGGVALLKNEHADSEFSVYDTVPYVKVGCGIPICKQAADEQWSGSTSAELGPTVASCVCVATTTYELIRNDVTSEGDIDPSAYTADQQETFEAFCGIQDCYDTMEALKNMPGFKDYCVCCRILNRQRPLGAMAVVALVTGANPDVPSLTSPYRPRTRTPAPSQLRRQRRSPWL